MSKRYIVFILLFTSLVFAIPRTINYQGKLTNSHGIGTNEDVSITFSIYYTPDGGSAVWSETHDPVSVSKGLFNVELGSIESLDLAFDAPYYLEINVEGSVMTPRIALKSEAYAFRSAIADSAVSVGWASIVGVPDEISDGDNGFLRLRAESGSWIMDSLTIVAGDNITLIQRGDSISISANFTGEGDDWGDQDALVDATLYGNGDETPLRIAQQGASIGQVLKWAGSTWYPYDDIVGDLESTLEIGNSAGYYDINMNGQDLLNVENIYVDYLHSDDASYVRVYDHLYPSSSNMYDLGSDSYEWGDLYVDGVGHFDAIELGGTTIYEWPSGGSGESYWYDAGSYLRPASSGDDVCPNGTASLGTSSYGWDMLYVDDIECDYSITAGSLDLGYYGDISCDEIECRPSSRSSGSVLLLYSNYIYYQSSSRRYKHDINSFKDNPYKLLNIRSVEYICNTGLDKNIGFIAEELDSAGLFPLVNYDEKGDPEGIRYDLITVYLVDLLKDYEKRITELENKSSPLFEFGNVIADSSVTYIKFSPEFSSELHGNIPYITITPNSSNQNYFIEDKSCTGFTLICSNPSEELSFDWIAISNSTGSRRLPKSNIPQTRESYLIEWKKGPYSPEIHKD